MCTELPVPIDNEDEEEQDKEKPTKQISQGKTGLFTVAIIIKLNLLVSLSPNVVCMLCYHLLCKIIRLSPYFVFAIT